MSRWRSPAAASTPIITGPGFQALKAELDVLWNQRRPEVVKALAAAAAEGDRSENAEYTYRKKQLGEIDRRVRYLSRRIPRLRLVASAPTDRQVIYFGARTTLQDAASGRQHHYRIVGADETDAQTGAISIDSPMARGMLGKRVGDEFTVRAPRGDVHLVILAIEYIEDASCPPE